MIAVIEWLEEYSIRLIGPFKTQAQADEYAAMINAENGGQPRPAETHLADPPDYRIEFIWHCPYCGQKHTDHENPGATRDFWCGDEGCGKTVTLTIPKRKS